MVPLGRLGIFLKTPWRGLGEEKSGRLGVRPLCGMKLNTSYAPGQLLLRSKIQERLFGSLKQLSYSRPQSEQCPDG
jgi:hypothetical protein